MLTSEARVWLEQHVQIDGDGNVVGSDNTVHVTKVDAETYVAEASDRRVEFTIHDLHSVHVDRSQAGVIGDHAHVEGGVHFYAHPPVSPRARRNRASMLQLVRNTWIKGVLEQSLHGAALLELGMAYDPGAVDHPWAMVIQSPERPDRQVLPGTPILEIFDEVGGSLLILGEPGSGKTTTLLELARAAIARAEEDETVPIPVVLNLASWAMEPRPLAKWLVEELNDKYDIPRRVARPWIERDELWLLLDGLDEVKAEERDACVEAINTFRRDHLVPLAVCSRTGDYDNLRSRLRLRSAIVLQPLTQSQVDAYLAGAGVELRAVRATLREDSHLRELARSPLMLSIMVLAYWGAEPAILQGLETLGARRKHLLDTYVGRMFTHRDTDCPYAPEQIIYGLSWIARQMTARAQMVLMIETPQPDWLPEGEACQVRRTAGLIGAVLFALLGFLVSGLLGQIHRLLVGGLVTGLVGGLLGGLIGGPGRSIETVEKFDWSWSRAAIGLLLGALGGAALGAGTWTIAAPTFEAFRRRQLLRVLAMLFGFGGAVIGSVIGGLERAEVARTSKPTQGFQRTLMYSLFAALCIGPVLSVVAALGFHFTVRYQWTSVWWVEGLIVGLLMGITTRLIFGGQDLLLHAALRYHLRRSGFLPWHWARFFEDARDHILLRRVGGGYLFVHRILQRYFADLNPPPPPSKTRPERKSLSVSSVSLMVISALILFFAGKAIVIDVRNLVGYGYSYRGRIFQESGKSKSAIPMYDKALAWNSEDFAAYTNRGSLYQDLGEYEKALADYDRVLELDPNLAWAYNNRGTLYQDMGEYDKALADYDRALELDPKDATAYYNRGGLYQDMGEYDKALADYDRALELDPKHVSAYNNRGSLYQNMGEYEKALADYDRALELDPKYATAYYNRGGLYQDMGEYELALADYEYAAEFMAHPILYYKIAEIHAELSHPDEACIWLEEVIALDPEERVWIRIDPDFDVIRNTPCFQALIEGTPPSD
jgi:tetratricopeptide (TPR) repeat protein